MNNLRKDKNAQYFHRLICFALKEKDAIFADLLKIVQDWDVFFVPHGSLPGERWWAVTNAISADEIGRLKMAGMERIVLVPFPEVIMPVTGKKDLFYQAFELSHEFGHIVVFENEDLTAWLNCSFMRLSPKRKCPYIELRAFEEGIRIFEDILEKYDAEIKTKQKVRKFFQKVYFSLDYRRNFSSDCVIVLDNDKMAMKEESSFCPLADKLRAVLARLDV